MCFRLKRNAERLNIRVAWKIVTVTPQGYLTSQFKEKYWWGPGLAEPMEKRPYYKKRALWQPLEGEPLYNAHNGIYVFTNKRDAMTRMYGTHSPGWCDPVEFRKDKWWNGDALMRVLVDPADWVGSSENEKMALYTKVIVPEEQPFFKWY